MVTETITPTEEKVKLRVREGHYSRGVVERWLERGAQRKGRHINVPSVRTQTGRDPALRQTHLYGWADSFPADPRFDFLRTYKFPETNWTVTEMTDGN